MTEKARYKKQEEDAKLKHKLAIKYYRQHEVEGVTLAEIYLNAEKPFRAHKKDKKNANSKCWEWYNYQILPLLSVKDMLQARGMGYNRVLKGVDESINSNIYIKNEEGKLIGVPDNKTRHEGNKLLKQINDEQEEKALGGGSESGNKITIEITGGHLETARDVWDDIQD